jgi:carboxyl-terminal processing protease
VVCTLLTIHLNISNARRSPMYSLFDPLIDVTSIIQEKYVTATEDEKLVSGAINGMLHQLDPHSEYIPPSEVDEFHKQASGSYEGIGISIDTQEGILMVISPFEDSPAYNAGVKAGDVILEVDGETTKGWSGTQAVKMLTGDSGTKVRLKLYHVDGKEEEVEIVRSKITVPTIKGWRRSGVDGGWDFMLDESDKIGYIRLTQFTADAVEEFDKAIEICLEQGLDALIFDLRYNPGGLMSAAIGLVDRFIDDEVIVSTRGEHSEPQTTRGKVEGTLPKFHLVILINQGSASASEIVAGSLQDNNRAIIVGTRSWGKGSVQEVYQLPEAGAVLKLTTAHYYLPKGRCVHKLPGAEEWGVEPDIKEKFNRENAKDRNMLLQELTIDVLKTVDEEESPDADAEEPADPQVAVADLKLKQMERLLKLDNQLDQAYKQCKGLLRTRPKMQPLGATVNNL